MSQTSGGNVSPGPAQGPGEAQHSGLRTTAMICYVLYLVTFFIGFSAIIGVIIAYIKKPDASGTVWESHFKNLILVFWVMFAVFLLGVITLPVSLFSVEKLSEGDFAWPSFYGFVFPMLVWIMTCLVLLVWFLYRVIRGLIRAAEDRAF